MSGAPHPRLEALTDLIYAALFGETTWQAFLDALNETMPDAKSTLFFHDSIARTGGLSLASGIQDAEVDAYNRYYARINPWMPKAAVRPVGLGVIAEQMLPRSDLLKTEFYNDYIRAIGCESSVGVTIMRENGRSFNLSTLTSSADPERNRANADLLSDLAPHLKRAFDFIRRDRRDYENDEIGLALFDAIGVGIVYLREDRQIRSFNKAAERMLAEGVGLGISGSGRIVIGDAALGAQLDMLNHHHVSASTPPSSMLVKTKDGSVKCTVVRLQSDFITAFLEGPTIALIIERTGPALRADINETLARNKQLTAAEMRIASAIADGLSLREAATTHDVSYETARSHLKNIYSKLGVNSQVALVRRLMP
ncbi:helix-turn-helix transcriptional regulator [Rhizobium sp. Pop5]|uniref:helix-turn-helix transcriptional regulator n=1 Tax=Rhizobium sp. Pop5 TaxID=1223565 RepID=UPI000283A07A|nr:helix-turn-helix transcriptional regulator [Rhizobium sp. Pop5]EJZ22633.1 LuxR family transcriptional regulator [Rhizobium sp. Pop5]UVD57417.1 helix-turn-helix transcriptional regulator [Rhizobium sp. Pop5]